jgi:hypothetical protein
MATTTAPHPARDAARIAAWSAAVGLASALVAAAVSGRLSLDRRAAAATTLGALGFTAAFLAPFGAVLASFLTRRTAARRAVWFAAAALALLLAALGIFSGIGWLFGVAGLGLAAAWWLTKGSARPSSAAGAIALAVWLLLWLGAALGALWLRTTPACWDDGAGWTAARSATTCASDIIDDREGVLALGAVAIGLAGAALLAARGFPSSADDAA